MAAAKHMLFCQTGTNNDSDIISLKNEIETDS
jgi:hypothetical protein